jgi:hypothetical protein
MSAGLTLAGSAVGGLASVIKGPMLSSFAAMIPAAWAAMAPFAPFILAIGAIGAAILVLKLAWEGNWGDIQGKTRAVMGVIQPLLNSIGDIFRNIQAWLSTLVDAFRRALNGDITGIVQILMDIFLGIPSRMHQIGQSIVSGIWQGIQSMAGWLFSQAGNFARNIFDNIMRTIRGGSPSLLFAEVGESISMGISKGFTDNIPNLEVPNVSLPRIGFAGAGGSGAIGGGSGIYFAPGSIVVNGNLIGIDDLRREILGSVREAIQGGGFRGIIPTVSR